jgi:anti-sigma factor RsiW
LSPSTCEQISGELIAFLDEELGESERRQIATHVSTCLVCRRELDRLTAVQRWVADLPDIEPSAEFAEQFWDRMNAEPTGAHPKPRSLRSLWWVVPALAAAAVLAVSFRFMTRSSPTPTRPATPAERVVQALPAQTDRPAAATVAAESTLKDGSRQVASVDDLRPGDLPPDLLEHPELFLRLPVVRRLEKLEYFEAVRQEPGNQDGAG